MAKIIEFPVKSISEVIEAEKVQVAPAEKTPHKKMSVQGYIDFFSSLITPSRAEEIVRGFDTNWKGGLE